MSASDEIRRNIRTPRAVVCDGKVAIDTYQQAAEILARNHVRPRPGRNAYRCGHCNKYHIGSDSGRVARRKLLEFHKEKAGHE